MAITKLNQDLNIISALDDEPNDVGGLSAAQLKARFDSAGNIIKDYINNTLNPEIRAEKIPFSPSPEIPEESVQAAVENLQEQINNVANQSVTAAKIAGGAIMAKHIQPFAVTTEKLAVSAVTGAKIAVASIAESKFTAELRAKINAAGRWRQIGSYTSTGTVWNFSISLTESLSSVTELRFVAYGAGTEYTPVFHIHLGSSENGAELGYISAGCGSSVEGGCTDVCILDQTESTFSAAFIFHGYERNETGFKNGNSGLDVSQLYFKSDSPAKAGLRVVVLAR